MTRQNSKIETIGGKKLMTIEAVATAGSASINPQVNDIYGVEFDMYIAPLTGTPTVNEQIRLDIRNAIGSGRILIERGGTYAYTLDRAMLRHVVMPPLRFGDSGTNLTTATVLTVALTGLANGTQVKIGAGNLRIVKL